MRPTIGQILSGLALGAVAASMLVMPERFIGAEDGAVRGLMLRAPSERIVVRAAPIRPRRVHRPALVKRTVIVVERRAPVAITISRRLPARPRAAPPPPPPVRKVRAKRRPVAPPAIVVASGSRDDDDDDGSDDDDDGGGGGSDDDDGGSGSSGGGDDDGDEHGDDDD